MEAEGNYASGIEADQEAPQRNGVEGREEERVCKAESLPNQSIADGLIEWVRGLNPSKWKGQKTEDPRLAQARKDAARGMLPGSVGV